MARHFLSIDDLQPSELEHVLELATKVKVSPSSYEDRLAGMAVAMVFEKPSTRTRVSLEVGIAGLGAHPVALPSSELELEGGESIEDIGRALSRYVDAVVLRTFGQERLEGLARTATVPIVNALSDFEHPCQCLADLLTIREAKGRTAGLTLAYVGDGNNVANSLLLGGAKAGLTVRVASPPGFEPIPQVVQRAEEIGWETGGGVMVTDDPMEACQDADVLYTDVWASTGRGQEAAERMLVFQGYRLDGTTVGAARPDAIVMHCLPARRGQEITDEVLDGPQSVVWEQAENRLHTEKAILLWLLGRA